MNKYEYTQKLLGFQNPGRKRSREFVKEILELEKINYNNFKVIHITGTAGKGSVSKMISTTLVNSNYNIGLFTSPHLLNITERIQLNNKDISNEKFEEYAKYFLTRYDNLCHSECLFLIAIKYFYESDIDYFVCEAFVGGNYDTTNIFSCSKICVLTSIGLDHTNLLGDTIEEILTDKIGIITNNSIFFSRENNSIIKNKIKETNSNFYHVINYKKTNLRGEFQKENAAIAYKILEYLKIDSKIIEKSLLNINWPARLDFIEKNIIIDSAHNQIGMKRLFEYVNLLNKNYYVLFAKSKNKNFKDFENEMNLAKEIILTQPDVFKVEDPLKYSNKYKIIKNPIEAFNYLKNKLKNDDLLIVCGSIFLTSEILKLYRDSKTNILMTNN